MGLLELASVWEVAGLSNGDGGGATKRAPPLGRTQKR
jgi:hypothetical protein